MMEPHHAIITSRNPVPHIGNPYIGIMGVKPKAPVHMLNWAIRSVKFLGVEFDQSEDEEVSVSDTTHL